MLEHKYGLTPKEDALISFLTDKKIDFTPLFYNSAIPIAELFYFFIIAGNSFYSFNRIPSLFDELENFNIVRVENKTEKDLQKLRQTVRDESITTGVLINTLCNEENDRWEYIKAQGKQFVISNGGCENSSNLSALQLRKIYGGEFVRLSLLSDSMPCSKKLLPLRLFKPERYTPFYFVESDLNSIDKLKSKMSNMFYVYKVTRYRIMQYYSHFVDVEFMRDRMKQVESVCILLVHLKDGTNITSKCFALLHELNQLDVLIMSQLKEKLGEVK